MRITARLEYSVRALLGLAAATPGPVTARDLADSQHIPAGYVYDVLADLRRAELVQAVPGRGGGYRLNRAAGSITIGEVLRLLEGTEGAAPSPDEPLVARLHQLWSVAEGAAGEVLDGVTLAELASSRPARPVEEATG
jgi:Rrf2 family protein